MRCLYAQLLTLGLSSCLSEAVRVGDDDVVRAEVERHEAAAQVTAVIGRGWNSKPKNSKSKDGKSKDGKSKEGKGKAGKDDNDNLKSESQSEEANEQTEKGWQDMLQYLRDSDGEISENIVTRMMKHGGFYARGIVARDKVKKNEVLFKVPKSMWITIDNFPEMKETDLDCTYDSAKVVTALALEMMKDEDSKWYAYLENMPSREDFKRFYPRWAKDDLLSDFSGLALVESLKEKKEDEQDLRKCWEKWSKKHRKSGNEPDLGKLTWKEMELAYAWWRSRNYGYGEEGSALIPVSDFMNTAPTSDFNARWRAKSSTNGTKDEDLDYFEVYASKNVESGKEFFESYCRECHNTDLLETWGIYMEDNPVRVAKQSAEVCGRLLPKALEALQPPSSKSNDMTAPRCKPETLEKDQGPLRCSFARLTFESCDGVESKESKAGKQ